MQGGLYIIVLMDYYVAAWAPLICSLLTCVAIAWVYKLENFSANIKAMVGHNIGGAWHFLWKFGTPAILVVRIY